MEKYIKTYYCRDKWNDLIRISIDKNTIYFELGYCLKTSVKSYDNISTNNKPFFKWKYEVYINDNGISDINDNGISDNGINDNGISGISDISINDNGINDITLNCVNIVDKEEFINQDDVKYNMWHTLRCENLEKNFPKFASDLQKNFSKEEWIQIIIELFPSISSYPKKHCDFEDYDVWENILSKSWIQDKRQENWKVGNI